MKPGTVHPAMGVVDPPEELVLEELALELLAEEVVLEVPEDEEPIDAMPELLVAAEVEPPAPPPPGPTSPPPPHARSTIKGAELTIQVTRSRRSSMGSPRRTLRVDNESRWQGRQWATLPI